MYQLFQIRSTKKKHVLIVDNCSAHNAVGIPASDREFLEIVYLPKNSTAIIQPCDAGIINSFKKKYKTKVMELIVTELDNIQEL